MKKITVLILVILLSCFAFTGCFSDINANDQDVLYNDIVYKRAPIPNFNLALMHDHREYIGDFVETYDYGNQLYWEVYVLNEQADILFSDHATWTKPGYVFPDEYGEEFSKVEYVISEGILDTYTEDVTPLVTFDKKVVLEDVISSEPADITDYTTYGDIRFHYTNHADLAVFFQLCSYQGTYYLNVLEDTQGDSVLFEIKAEYVTLLTSAITSK